eukprot:m51a1_g12549 hypothetical protein (230) ;mRNA; f:409-3055
MGQLLIAEKLALRDREIKEELCRAEEQQRALDAAISAREEEHRIAMLERQAQKEREAAAAELARQEREAAEQRRAQEIQQAALWAAELRREHECRAREELAADEIRRAMEAQQVMAESLRLAQEQRQRRETRAKEVEDRARDAALRIVPSHGTLLKLRISIGDGRTVEATVDGKTGAVDLGGSISSLPDGDYEATVVSPVSGGPLSQDLVLQDFCLSRRGSACTRGLAG